MDRTPRTVDEWEPYRLVYTGVWYEVQIHWTSPESWEVLCPEDATRVLARRLEERVNALTS
jgi:hypothetical protein